jgi:hypothetical protein
MRDCFYKASPKNNPNQIRAVVVPHTIDHKLNLTGIKRTSIMEKSKNTFEVKSLLDAVRLLDKRGHLTVGQYTDVVVESISRLMSRERLVKSIDPETGEESPTGEVVTDYYYIVNVNAMSDYHLDKAEEFINNGDFLAAVNQRHSFNAYVNAGEDCPYQPTEIIKVLCEVRTSKNGVTAEWITKHMSKPVVQMKKISFMDRLKKSEEPAVEETEEVLEGETVVDETI